MIFVAHVSLRAVYSDILSGLQYRLQSIKAELINYCISDHVSYRLGKNIIYWIAK